MNDKNGMLTDRSTGRTVPLPFSESVADKNMSDNDYESRCDNQMTDDRCNSTESRRYREKQSNYYA